MSILIHLLTRKKELSTIGATEREIIDSLNYKGKNENIFLQDMLQNVSKAIEPLGLVLRYNPLNSHWFISHETEISELIEANPFSNKPKLAATLFCVLACCLKSSGTGKIHEINKLRNKKSITDDLKDLAEMGFIFLDMDEQQVSLTPLIGYQLDLNKLFTNLALKVK